MGLCMFNYVFYMPSSLPLLHTATPTPCLNAFWHSDPYILSSSSYIFLGNVFVLFYIIVTKFRCTIISVLPSQGLATCYMLRASAPVLVVKMTPRVIIK